MTTDRPHLAATDDCALCGKPILFNDELEVYYAEGRDWEGYDCPIAGQFGHTPEEN